MKQSKWDIVDNLGTETRTSNMPSPPRRAFRAMRGSVMTSLMTVSLLLAVPASSRLECRLAGPNPAAAAFGSLPTPIVRIRRANRHRTKDDQRLDTRTGFTSRQLANRFSIFFKPADPEPEDSSDYSFF